MSEKVVRLEQEIARLKKINKVLMERVERSVDSAGSDFTLFEHNILLQKHVESRTAELENANARLASLLDEQRQVCSKLAESEERYRLIFNQSKDAMMTVSCPEWSFSSFNPALCDMFRVKDRESFKGAHPWEISPERQPDGTLSKDKALKMLEKAMSKGSHSFEWTHKRFTGEVFPSTVLLTRIQFAGQLFVHATVRDITEQKKAQEVLEKSELRVRMALESVPEGIMAVDAQSKVFILANKTICRMIGYQWEELSKMSIFQIHPENELSRVRDAFERMLLGELSYIDDIMFLRSNGSVFFADIKAVKMELEGKPCLLAIIIDTSERKRMQQEKERLQIQLNQSQKMESVGRLAGGVAHDFNNLLQAMGGNIHLLLMNKTEDHPDVDRLKTVSRSIDRAAQLVSQLLLFSRKADVQRKHVNLNHEIAEAVKMLKRTIPRMIRIKLDLDSATWPIHADPVQVEQVLLNLGKNSADAMPRGGSLLIKTENKVLGEEFIRDHPEMRPGRYVLLKVSDTGIGMDKETAQNIFEPFFTTKDVGKGTGLGLPSVYGIVKGHGGEIKCESEPGRGTVFSIYFPAATGEEAESCGTERVSSRTTRGSGSILVVDDEDDIRELTSEVLEHGGYKVVTAENGEEAVKVFAESKDLIDMVILDLNMPGMGGQQCLGELLKLDPEARVLIASGYSADVQVRDAIQSGAAGFIGKPYQISELIEKVEEVLGD